MFESRFFPDKPLELKTFKTYKHLNGHNYVAKKRTPTFPYLDFCVFTTSLFVTVSWSDRKVTNNDDARQAVKATHKSVLYDETTETGKILDLM